MVSFPSDRALNGNSGRAAWAPSWRRFAGACLLLSLIWVGSACGGNAGRVFDPTPPGSGNNNGGGGGGGGGNPPGPSSAPIPGALQKPGRPVVRSMFPAPGSTGVDVQAPIVLWMSESINPATVSTASVGVRPRDSQGSIAFTLLELVAGRCLALLPTSNLQTNTTYEVFVTDALTDLQGQRVKVPKGGVFGRFITANAVSGVAPQVLGACPANNDSLVPNDHQAVVIFSKPIDFNGVTDAIDLMNGAAPADYGFPQAQAGNRIVVYDHLNDDTDLGGVIELTVLDSLTDTEFTPIPLAAQFDSQWTTAGFGRPSEIRVLEIPAAVNIGNLQNFRVEVDVPAVTQAVDLTLLVHESIGSDEVEQTVPVPAGGGVPVLFTLDLSAVGNNPVLNDGPLTIAASLSAAGGESSTMQVLDGTLQDTVAPSLEQYGPPFATVPSRFYTDVPELRPYGIASEPISQVDYSDQINAAVRIAPIPSPNDFFIGPSVDIPNFQEGPFEFEIQLTDAAGNTMDEAAGGSVLRRGFIGNIPAAGNLRVVAFNARTMAPVTGAEVYVQNATGPNFVEDFGVTGSDGSVEFDDAVGPGQARVGAQTITIMHPSFHAASVCSVDSDLLSVPLREIFNSQETVSPVITGATSGDSQLGSSLFRENFVDSADGLLEVTLPLVLGNFEVRPDRPGWFVAFHNPTFDSLADTAPFDLAAIEPRILVDPSGSSMPQISPALLLGPTANQGKPSAEYVYLANAFAGVGFGTAEEVSAGVATVIPGLDGFALIGGGAVSSLNSEIELEESFLPLVTAEGGDASVAALRMYARDEDGNEAMTRELVTVEPNPPNPFNLALPDIPAPAPPTGTTYPVTLNFIGTLSGLRGYYLLRLQDSDTPANEWDLWVPASFAPAGSVDLPTLADTPGGAAGVPPLLTGSGNQWTLLVTAYEMRTGFNETGVFFTQFRRENLSFARTQNGAPFTVD